MKNAAHNFPLWKKLLNVMPLLILLLLASESASAATELVLPYEQGLGAFMDSMQGTVPFAISLVGIVACGAMLIFGGEISGFMRTMIFIILVVAVIVQAENIVSGLGGSRTGNTETPRTLVERSHMTAPTALS